MTLDAFFRQIEEDNRRRPRTHSLAAPLTDRELLLWEKAHSPWTVPDSLISFLRRSNGIRLRMNKDSPEGADCSFRALKDIREAASVMYGDDCDGDEVPKSWFALAHDADCTSVLVLDLQKEQYFDVDPIDPDEPLKTWKSLQGALTWLSNFFLDPAKGR